MKKILFVIVSFTNFHVCFGQFSITIGSPPGGGGAPSRHEQEQAILRRRGEELKRKREAEAAEVEKIAFTDARNKIALAAVTLRKLDENIKVLTVQANGIPRAFYSLEKAAEHTEKAIAEEKVANTSKTSQVSNNHLKIIENEIREAGNQMYKARQLIDLSKNRVQFLENSKKCADEKLRFTRESLLQTRILKQELLMRTMEVTSDAFEVKAVLALSAKQTFDLVKRNLMILPNSALGMSEIGKNTTEFIIYTTEEIIDQTIAQNKPLTADVLLLVYQKALKDALESMQPQFFLPLRFGDVIKGMDKWKSIKEDRNRIREIVDEEMAQFDFQIKQYHKILEKSNEEAKLRLYIEIDNYISSNKN